MWTAVLLIACNAMWVWWVLRKYIKIRKELEHVSLSYAELVHQLESQSQQTTFVKIKKKEHYLDREAKKKKPKYKKWLDEYESE
jgi:hypothetical protein